jgi:ABC-2 type transport system permease protein
MSIYWSAVTSGARRVLNEPADLVVRTLFYVFILVIFSALWKAAVASNGGEIAGYSYIAMLWYVVGAEGSVIATKPRLIEEVGEAIGQGSIAVEMLRPVSVVGFRMAVELGEALVRLALAVVVGALLGLAYAGAPPNATAALMAVPALILGVASIVVSQHLFAAATFWLEDAKSMWFLYQKLIFLLGGMLLPLEFLPSWLEGFARATPFMTMAYAPARLLSGHVEPVLILIQIGWLAAMFAAVVAVFSVGERRLQVAGG